MKTISDACEAKGQAFVLADLGDIPLNREDPCNIHENFIPALRNVIEGYSADNNYMPDTFEIIAHSMGGAAALTLAKDFPISGMTLLDPVLFDGDVLETVNCSTSVVLSDVRSFRSIGQHIFRELSQQSQFPHTLYQIGTSKEREEGHMFRGQTAEIARIIRGNVASGSDFTLDEPDGLVR